MKLFQFFILLSVWSIGFISLADNKKVEIANADGLKGPTQKAKSLEEVLQKNETEEAPSCLVALKERPYSADMAKAQRKQSELFAKLSDKQHKIVINYIDFDEKKLDLMLKLVYGVKDSTGDVVKKALNEEELNFLIIEVIPFFKDFRSNLLTDVFFSVAETPDLFFSESQDLFERVSKGHATEEDVELLNGSDVKVLN